MQRHGLAQPIHLFASSHASPDIPCDLGSPERLTDAKFINALRSLNLTPEEILSSPELMAMFLPMLRADFSMACNYAYRPQAPLAVLLTFLAGCADTDTTPAVLARVSWPHRQAPPLPCQSRRAWCCCSPHASCLAQTASSIKEKRYGQALWCERAGGQPAMDVVRSSGGNACRDGHVADQSGRNSRHPHRLITIKNGTQALLNASESLVNAGQGAAIIDGNVQLGNLVTNGLASSADTITPRHKHTYAVNEQALVWKAAGTVADMLVKGADIGWLSEMEAAGKKFYTVSGTAQQAVVTTLKENGIDAIRLRVWGNPPADASGKVHNDIKDVLRRAQLAAAAGMKPVIDFYYSDGGADPGQQTKPATRKFYTQQQLNDAVATGYAVNML